VEEELEECRKRLADVERERAAEKLAHERERERRRVEWEGEREAAAELVRLADEAKKMAEEEVRLAKEDKQKAEEEVRKLEIPACSRI
jgi:hypothetical protein